MAEKSCGEVELLKSLETKKDERLSFLQEALCIARKAGKIIADVFHETKNNIQIKATCADLVTETDKEVEKLIFDTLRSKFPSHSFIGEESVSEGSLQCKLTDNPTWIVDPIDGTMNFVHMNTTVAVSIGLVIKKQTEVGVVYAPMRDQMFYSVRGEGSYLNGKKLRVNTAATDLSEALVATEYGSRRDETAAILSENIRKLLMNHRVAGIRCTGSAALNMCDVACGSVDIYYEWGPQCWDVCAGQLISHEAGGITTNALGGEYDMMCRSFICACNKNLIDQIIPTLTQVPLN